MDSITSILTPIGLAGTFIWNGMRKVNEGCLKKIKQYEQTLLAVAIMQYVITYNMTDTKQIMIWRYLDWVITTPLLLKTVHLFAIEKGYTGTDEKAISGNMTMILCGFLAENAAVKAPNTAHLLNIIGFYGFWIVLSEVNKWISYLEAQGIDNAKKLRPFFYLGWTGYGVNQYNTTTSRQTVFNVLDFINKGLFTIVFNTSLITTS
jgi:bacteriorhodopsin